MDPMTWLLAGGMGLNFLGNYFSSKEGSDANKANLMYQLQKQQLIGNHVNQMMQPGMNPFAQAMLNFTGQKLPGSYPSFDPRVAGMVNGTVGTMDPNNPPVTGQGSGGESGNPGGSGDPSVLYNMIPGNGGQASFNPSGINYSSSAYNFDPSRSMSQNWAQAQTDAQANTGWMNSGPWQQQGMIGTQYGNDPSQMLAAYNNQLAQSGFSPQGQWMASMAARNGLPQGMDPSMGFSGVDPTRPGQAPGRSGWASPGDFPGIDLSGGISGYPPEPYDQNPGGGLPATDVPGPWQGPANQPGGMGGSGGMGGGMYQYQNPGAFLYNPSMLGQAPQIGGMPQLNAPGGLTPERVGATGTQAQNAGQDALMQMMRKNLQPSQDPGLDLGIQQLGQGASQYDMTGMFKSLDDQARQGLDDQIAQLHGSAGSLGERYGSAMTNAEGRLRTNSLLGLNSQKQGLGMQAFEAAQGRRLPALGLGADLQNQGNQFNLQGLGLQSGMARDLAGLGQQGSALDLQAQLANQGTGLQAGQFNAGQNMLAQQGNQGAWMQAALANQGLAGQYGLANQASMNAGGQFNAGQRTMNDQFAAQQGNIYNNFMMQALSQGAGLQANQNSYNASLLGILAGVPTPQTQPTTWGNTVSDLGGMMAMPWLYNQFARG